MGNPNEPTTPDLEQERHLRGPDLEGPEQDDAVDHESHLKQRNPDTEIRLDGEKDDLYDDGIDVDESTEPPAGTRGNAAGAKG
ncbi:MAG TPA: hypothetical protein VKT22_08920 [Steroidobacteraceae bacterium]|nr:hypothetical protein [Steroidobacteraceae bacterium]